MPEQAIQLTPEQQKALQEKLKNMSPEELREFQKQQCIFCQIITGKIPAKKIYEDDKTIAVLDINPAAKGHLLLLPKEHYAIMPQLPDQEISLLFTLAKRLSHVVLKALKLSGTTIFVANGLAAGQRAQHLMIHIIPRKEGDGLLMVNESPIDEAVQKAARTAIRKKLLEQLGEKKAIVDIEEPAPEEGLKPLKTNEKAGKRKKKSKSKTTPNREEAPAAEAAPEDAVHAQENTEEQPDGDADLDDIARLFT